MMAPNRFLGPLARAFGALPGVAEAGPQSACLPAGSRQRRSHAGSHQKARKGGSYEYIVDIGTAPAQRCEACGQRFWLERRPWRPARAVVAGCVETEERRRADQGWLLSRKEAQAAMDKVMVAVAERSYVAPSKADRARVPRQGVAAGHRVDGATDDLPLLRAARHLPHRAPHRLAAAGEAVRGADQRPLRQARKPRQAGRQDAASRPAPCTTSTPCLHRAFRDAVRWGRLFRNPVDAADPPRVAGPGRAR